MNGTWTDSSRGITVGWEISSYSFFPLDAALTLKVTVTTTAMGLKADYPYYVSNIDTEIRRYNIPSPAQGGAPPSASERLGIGGRHADHGPYTTKEYTFQMPALATFLNGSLYAGIFITLYPADGSVTGKLTPIPLPFADSPLSNTPIISEFTAKRCDVNGNLSDEGQYIRNTIKGSIAPGMGWDAADHTLRVGYRLQGSTGAYTWVSKTGFTAAVDIDEKLGTGAVFAAGSVYEIRCELINNERSITVHTTSVLPKAFANLHLSGSGYGVGIGQYSTATEETPKFECAYPAHFYGGAKDADGKAITAGPLIQAGLVAPQGNVGSGNYRDTTVTFPTAFKTDTTPVVVVGFDSGSTSGTFGRCCVSTYTYGISNTGFTLRFYNGDSSNRNPGFTWIALGERA